MSTPVPTERYKNHRFPTEIISHGVWLYGSVPRQQAIAAIAGPTALGRNVALITEPSPRRAPPSRAVQATRVQVPLSLIRDKPRYYYIVHGSYT